MAHLNWKYAQNMFLTATDRRRPRMLQIGADHVAKLTAKLGSPADPDVQVCLNRAQPLFDAFQLAMVVFDVRSGTRKGQTEVLVDLLKELTAVRVPQWDITVQGTFIAGTPEYTQIFPNGRGPFQSGQQDARILAVQTLGQRLPAVPAVASLEKTGDAFHASLNAARTTQQGTEGQIGDASNAAEQARVALGVGLYANLGRLMEKHAAGTDELGEYFEVALLRGTAPSLPTFDFNWQPSGTGVNVAFIVPAGVSGTVSVLLREGAVELATTTAITPGETKQIAWPNVTIVDDVDEVVLRDASGADLARGVRDITLPEPVTV